MQLEFKKHDFTLIVKFEVISARKSDRKWTNLQLEFKKHESELTNNNFFFFFSEYVKTKKQNSSTSVWDHSYC